MKKGFLETQNKVNGWITTLKKRIDGEDDDCLIKATMLDSPQVLLTVYAEATMGDRVEITTATMQTLKY